MSIRWVSRAISKSRLRPTRPQETVGPVTAAAKPAPMFGMGSVPSGTLKNAVNDLGVLADLVLESGKHAHVNPVGGLDAVESSAEGLLYATFGDPPGGQNLEGETGLLALP